MKLHELSPHKGAKTSPKRIGRGPGSGTGKTSGKGHKGHKARSGGGVRPGFEGGQMPIHRRLPKVGFTNIFKKDFAVINIRDLLKFESGSLVDEALLVTTGVVKGRHDGIKLLAQGDIDYSLTIKLNRVSNGARAKIEKAGGKIEVI
ncbi:MAG: 50S ribosomal protein L15 [Desulfobacterium sp.]|nr:50S ribosomal protein L15 [Desulfobacterium sp.]MBU3947125.1 50S ribosomal protein L15 [Pseudomonadota bacterium]MBU4010863.1 50S ribosomal protein L15 [Pseudomonadota bacterium]MBU4037097.1 50S ribosomal protein L15 [Pseudomonadota bacterium]